MFSNGAMHKVASCSMQQINVCVVCFDILRTHKVSGLLKLPRLSSHERVWSIGGSFARGRVTAVPGKPTPVSSGLLLLLRARWSVATTACSRCIPSRTWRRPSGMYPYPPIPSLLSELEKCCCVMDCLVELNLRMHITTESLKFAHSTQ